MQRPHDSASWPSLHLAANSEPGPFEPFHKEEMTNTLWAHGGGSEERCSRTGLVWAGEDYDHVVRERQGEASCSSGPCLASKERQISRLPAFLTHSGGLSFFQRSENPPSLMHMVGSDLESLITDLALVTVSEI